MATLLADPFSILWCMYTVRTIFSSFSANFPPHYLVICISEAKVYFMLVTILQFSLHLKIVLGSCVHQKVND